MEMFSFQDKSGARVNLAKDSNELTITGDDEQISSARALIAEYLVHGGPKPDKVNKVEVRKVEFYVCCICDSTTW